MKLVKNGLLFALSAVVLAGVSQSLQAQNVDAAMLLHPPADSWPGYQGDYSGQRHSPLKQITPQNVADLSLAWAFQTGQPAEIKATPLLVDGVLYFTVPDNVWAIDAAPVKCCGTTPTHRIKGITSASVALACIRIGFSSFRRMHTSCL